MWPVRPAQTSSELPGAVVTNHRSVGGWKQHVPILSRPGGPEARSQRSAGSSSLFSREELPPPFPASKGVVFFGLWSLLPLQSQLGLVQLSVPTSPPPLTLLPPSYEGPETTLDSPGESRALPPSRPQSPPPPRAVTCSQSPGTGTWVLLGTVVHPTADTRSRLLVRVVDTQPVLTCHSHHGFSEKGSLAADVTSTQGPW